MNLKKGGKKGGRRGKKKEIQERFHPLWEDLDEFGKGEKEGKKVGRKETQERNLPLLGSPSEIPAAAGTQGMLPGSANPCTYPLKPIKALLQILLELVRSDRTPTMSPYITANKALMKTFNLSFIHSFFPKEFLTGALQLWACLWTGAAAL